MNWQLDNKQGETLLQFIDDFNEHQKRRESFDDSVKEIRDIISDGNEKQQLVNDGFKKSLDRIEKKIVPEPRIRELISTGIKDYDHEKVLEENKELKRKEESQQINVSSFPTPQDGVNAVKTPIHKNPYVMAPTIGTGAAAFIYAVVDLIIKMNGGG